MDGKYLASNIGPLKTIGEGKVFIAVNDLLNPSRFEDVELAAYSIEDSDRKIVTINCLFKQWSVHTKRNIYFFRSYDLYKETGLINDGLKLTADHGIGFADFEIDDFIELRDFYLQRKGSQ